MDIASSRSSSSSDNKVQNCSKQRLESFKTLQKNFHSEKEKHNRAKLEIQGYELALESLESRILGHENNEMAWGEKYEFQNNDLKLLVMSIFEVRSRMKRPQQAYDRNSDDEDDVSEVIPETQTVKTQVDKIGQISKKEGIGFKKIKACFVCKSTDHLIRDCDFHEKRMAKQVELNKLKGKGTGQGEKRPVWNNVHRLNHQNNFVPKAVLTKIGRFPVNAARQNLSSQATTTSTARKVNTARPIGENKISNSN
ncbi:hypothetical protein Tco_0661395 [Tanacetum coccineum]